MTISTLISVAAILIAIQVANEKAQVTEVSSELTYTENIRPIFVKRCSTCHNSGTPERNWLNYETAVAKAIPLYIRLAEETMPPAGWPLPKEERDMIIHWLGEGAKE
jgi:uncharacterized membrane protein